MPEDVGGQPARTFHPDLTQEPAPATGEGQPPVESGQPVVQKVFVGGRERTLDEVVSGYEASTQEAQRLGVEGARLAAEKEASDRIAAAYREMLESQRQQQPVEPPDLSDPAEAQRWMEQTAQRIADERIKATEQQISGFINGIQGLQKAQVAMKAADPQFDPAHLGNYLAANPVVQSTYDKLFGQDQVAALDYAWTKAKSTLKQATAATPSEAAAVAPTPTLRVPEASTGNKSQLLEAAKQEAFESGDWTKYYAMRLKGTSADRNAELGRQ